MLCKNCGNQLPDGTAFCSNCGAAQSLPAPAPAAEQPVAAPAPVAVPVAPVAAPAPSPAMPYVDPTVMVEQPAPVAQPPQGYAFTPAPVPAPAKKGHKGLIITLIIVIVVAGLGVTGWFLYDNGTFDDWFGGSTSSSQEEKEEESKDGSSSDNSSASSDPNGTASEEGVNSELNQGTPVTPPTSSVSSSVEAVIMYTPGETVNGVYTNQWANIKYDTAKAPTALTITSDEELASKKRANYEYGFIFMDSTGQNLQLMFEDCTGANVTKEEYMDIACDQMLLPLAQQGYSVTVSAKSTTVIAGQVYASSVITATAPNGINLKQKLCVYKKDNYIICIIATAQNETNLNGMLNIFETAY